MVRILSSGAVAIALRVLSQRSISCESESVHGFVILYDVCCASCA